MTIGDGRDSFLNGKNLAPFEKLSHDCLNSELYSVLCEVIDTYKRGGELDMALRADYDYTQDDLDNHADQLNPNNDAYWESRDYGERPDDWESRLEDDSSEEK